MTITGEHNGPGVAQIGKLAVLVVTGKNSHLDRHQRGDPILLQDRWRDRQWSP